MSNTNRTKRADEPSSGWTSGGDSAVAGEVSAPIHVTTPSEGQSHTEHQAALDATLFRTAADPYELVLELHGGELRLRPGDASR